MEFIAATNNPGKMAEMRRILERMGHTVRSQREAGGTLEPEENGTTFAAVSYTHLDVYKRQGESMREKLAAVAQTEEAGA